MFDLRYYQEELVQGTYAAWEQYRSTAIIAATGTGKSETYLSIATRQPGRVMIVVHRDYLITSPVSRLASIGFDDIGIEKAEKRSDVGFVRPKLVFASVYSIGPESQAARLDAFDPFDFGTLVIDEGHRATSVIYRRVMEHFGQNPKLKTLLLTATPKRRDGVALGNVCESVAGEYGPATAISEGWIVPLRFVKRNVLSMDFSRVRLKGTDLDQDQVAALFREEESLHEICRPLADDAGPGVVFCPKVDVAQAMNALMNSRYRPGRSAVLWEGSDTDERERVFNGLRDGTIDNLFQVDIATEGLDIPGLQRVVWAAPTASLVRYTQGVGRGFRPDDSLRGKLTGGREDAEQRRTLIASSPKPFCTVVTYYPQNCKHQLCDPVDILGGDDLPPDVKEAAKQVQEIKSGGSCDPEEAIATAKEWIDVRKLLEKRRAKIVAEAQYTDQEYDGFGGTRNRGGADKKVRQPSTDWPAGDPATPKQIGWFNWKEISIAGIELTKFRAIVVRDLIDLGIHPETALSYSRRQAMAVREKLKKAATA